MIYSEIKVTGVKELEKNLGNLKSKGCSENGHAFKGIHGEIIRRAEIKRRPDRPVKI